MNKITICLACLAMLMIASIAMAQDTMAQDNQNTTSTANNTTNKTVPGVHVGFKTVKPVSNLDRYGMKPAYDIEAYSNIKPGYNLSAFSNIQPMFNVSQRAGQPSRITYTTGQTKPMYSANIPGKPVYNIENYSPIKILNPLP